MSRSRPNVCEIYDRTDLSYWSYRIIDEDFLSRVAIVRANNSAELLLATDGSTAFHNESFVKHAIAYTSTLVRAFGVVMDAPCFNDVVHLFSAEAKEMVKAFFLQRADERFDKGVRLGRFQRDFNTSSIPIFPKSAELLRELAVRIVNEETRLYADIVQPMDAFRACCMSHASFGL